MENPTPSCRLKGAGHEHDIIVYGIVICFLSSDTSESGDDSSDDDEDSLEHLIQQPKPKLLAWLLKKGR